MRTKTLEAPDELGAIRFYAAPLPEFPTTATGVPRSPVTKLVGFDGAGQVVACLVAPMPAPGVPLAACSASRQS